MTYKIGFDIGSTTIKAVVLDENQQICYKSYERHKAQVRQKALEKIKELERYTKEPFQFAISGSGALGLCDDLKLPFVQEVFASATAIRKYYPDTDCAIELGGEDAKILFFKGSIEQRMNSTCAGGTGAFIDQMASLLDVDLETMNEVSLKHDKIYPIASRCGVFAKTDVQPLINQGVSKSNLSASIFQAVVDQTITSLAQGRNIEGNVLFLGGPLYFLSGLRDRFQETLKLADDQITCPDTAINFVALGAALCADKMFTRDELVSILEDLLNAPSSTESTRPLFEDKADYETFKARHHQSDAKYADLSLYTGKAYLGVDSGSTTTKLVLLNEDHEILYESYTSNKGDPLAVVRADLMKIYETNPNIRIYGSYATGYGEELMRHAFHLDGGIVETIAHYTAACLFNPEVDYILDIGGQDIKCFKIRDGRIDDIVLNEACSSGCGSFIETFAKSLGYDVETFAQLGLKSKNPVELGTRCTVFMNSGVKQAQKNGATIEDISAGLCKSVVKNALYKVIRAKNKKDIGEHIVVQGGTFQNDAVLRSFEQELGLEVIRPSIAHLMGAFGAALYAQKLHRTRSSILNYEQLKNFTHKSVSTTCQGCTNHCALTINTFSDGSRLVAGNKCEKMIIHDQKEKLEIPDLFKEKASMMQKVQKNISHDKKIGMPLVLNNYDLLPFWTNFFDVLGYEVVWSTPSTLDMYHDGQHTIPSDTACFPAKLVHGHIKQLVDQELPLIFYPCMTYNLDENQSDNHYNCPLVAYYPEVIAANMDLNNTKFLYPFISFDNEKNFVEKMIKAFETVDIHFNKNDVKIAFRTAMNKYRDFHEELVQKHIDAVKFAREHNLQIAVLCGRPYHLDPLVNHQINQLLTTLGFVVVSEESVPRQPAHKVNVLNQWTYHARLYQAAHYVCENPDMNLIQLVSFGCGIDAITTDEVKAILKEGHKFYTQIKIDEIDNQGAVKIRLRSLQSALAQNKGGQHG
ncbi:acyl-CoA dehydratase activase [Faecalitalea cylindroides]|uniref:acyl-CoA dehydratase activase n=1 Tax=Faecalitalea cylindroides TaxID=39483 RepID=UPI00232C72A5|nr:acyl-CoA dehydratase activase [Faecalitalea cylindroides]MDB7952340.1 acyl-CoA dehydratase activase [Faecalitalea cylindroides]MDB7959032.1 acyl-CoA dehydratase activase [Faecalitalea cylindroides]MDB7960791.1 acyl-CoA dehydratase activase [Faecalitalea cylindroides]MDB7962960.1 acyl-CoA dehydratase activase [Faecalitalea cylindroides]MDB7964805.1 acyl-CoA dehydratase activase [Faecalitalea cylindroides]